MSEALHEAILAMTYIQAGRKEFGLELARRHWDTLVCRQRIPWDLPNSVSGEKGERRGGTEYSQVMMLWALPAAVQGMDLAKASAPASLVNRIVRAGRNTQTISNHVVYRICTRLRKPKSTEPTLGDHK